MSSSLIGSERMASWGSTVEAGLLSGTEGRLIDDCGGGDWSMGAKVGVERVDMVCGRGGNK